MSFERSVFINCPFDEKYLNLLRPMIFTILYVGLEPRIALERLNSGESRFEKIVELIRSCKYGVHDLSRLKANKKGEYFRLNMPFELGVDVGCQRFCSGPHAEKKILILETEKYRLQAALSDMSNSDIEAHGDDPVRLVTVVRNWLHSEAGLKAPGPSEVWGRFNDVMADIDKRLRGSGYSDADIQSLPIVEFIAEVRRWLAAQPARTRGR